MEVLEIEGVRYVPASSVAHTLSVTRQTLWRWRQEGKIPPGHRFRDRRVLFTEKEVKSICDFANRIEPISAQLNNEPLSK